SPLRVIASSLLPASLLPASPRLSTLHTASRAPTISPPAASLSQSSARPANPKVGSQGSPTALSSPLRARGSGARSVQPFAASLAGPTVVCQRVRIFFVFVLLASGVAALRVVWRRSLNGFLDDR